MPRGRGLGTLFVRGDRVQSAGTGSMVDRMVGVARLDVPTYEAIEHDQSATTPALIVVVLAAIAGGIGSLGEGGEGFIGGILGTVLFWAVFSGVAYFVGTRLLGTPDTSSSWQEVLRTLGFAYTPLLLGVFGIIPFFGWIIAIVAVLWFLCTATIALRQALDMSTGRAIGTALISLIPALIVVGIIGRVFGIGT